MSGIDEQLKEMHLDNVYQEGESVILPILPLRNAVVYPEQGLQIQVGTKKSLELIEALPEENKFIGVVALKENKEGEPALTDMFNYGTLAQVLKVFDVSDGNKSVVVKGLKRMKVTSWESEEPYFSGRVELLDEHYDSNDMEIDAFQENIQNVFRELVELAPYLSSDQQNVISNIRHPGRVSDLTMATLPIQNAKKQEILAELNVKERLKKTARILHEERQRLQVGQEIQSEAQDKMSKTQREYYLREQMKAIKKELGGGDEAQEIQEFRRKIEEQDMPEEARNAAEKELDRLEKISPQSPEYTVSRTYLDWLTSVPWNQSSDDLMDVQRAKEILDRDHYGLDEVKTRVLEYLAVRQLKREKEQDSSMKGPILCFIGPPGVGKTSIGKSIAEAMNREFIRLSLGGVRDEAEIRGHRRTYVGSLPGRIIQEIEKAGTNNPVFMLDEIDKLSASFRGDPASALLEVLDPEQNDAFSDHYLEVPFDLSRVMFIATGNYSDPIPPALKDRMEIIEFPGYIEQEKLHIAKRYLIPKQQKEQGLEEEELEFTDDAVRELMHHYTRESGVRNLEREIANVFRKIAREVVETSEAPGSIRKEDIREYLGPQKYFSEVAERMTKPGIAMGLAWTPTGGEILFIEATTMRGEGKLKLTGQLGDVMKESAEAALSYVRSRGDDWKIDVEAFDKKDVHIHVPKGAIQKDGPSAGITIFAAIVSLFTGRMVKDNLGMTGELTLRGNVLPVGGIKEKVVAAHRAGLDTVILPEKNKKDLDEIPDQVKADITFESVKEMAEVVDLALEPQSEKEAA
ncbi:MAG TPA: endopeptidase La [bacterium]|nr:endopeptidase La [bacterium]